MNTIYDNTFTIGQTSAINFEAGPGVSITEPSAGTVRIGNDETVLWSGSEYLSASPVITANDYFTNYEKINFYVQTHPTVNDIHIDSHESTSGNGNEQRYDICTIGLLAGVGNAIRFNHACLTATSNTKEFHVTGPGQHTLTGTSIQTATCPALLVKIVGINRKEV